MDDDRAVEVAVMLGVARELKRLAAIIESRMNPPPPTMGVYEPLCGGTSLYVEGCLCYACQAHRFMTRGMRDADG